MGLPGYIVDPVLGRKCIMIIITFWYTHKGKY